MLTSLVSCGGTKPLVSQPITGDYKSVATKKLGEDVNYVLNDSKTYVLCTYEVAGSSQQPRNSLNYLVIKIKDNSIVMENRVDGGTVSWYDDNEIEVYLTPGMVRKDQTADDFKTLYNVVTGESRSRINSEAH